MENKTPNTPPPYQDPETPVSESEDEVVEMAEVIEDPEKVNAQPEAITEPEEAITEPEEAVVTPEEVKVVPKKKRKTNTLEPDLVGGGNHSSKSKDIKFDKSCMVLIAFVVAFFAFVWYAVSDDEGESSTPATTESSVTSSASTSTENVAQTGTDGTGNVASTARATSAEDAAIAAAGEIPAVPNPMTPVADFAGLFSNLTVREMKDSLEQLSLKTSNQIVVVTVTNLGDYTPNEFATKIGDKWGVGTKGTDNGVVILIKAKTADSKGQIYIAPGRGLEGALPDAFCRRVVDNEMLPIMKESGDYTAATWAALKVMMPICRGEYSVEKYNDDEDDDTIIELIIYVFIFGVIGLVLYSTFKGGGTGGGTSIGSSGLGSTGYGRSSWHDSGSSWSGGGGGFSFGGGSFGGGGAGGSW